VGGGGGGGAGGGGAPAELLLSAARPQSPGARASRPPAVRAGRPRSRTHRREFDRAGLGESLALPPTRTDSRPIPTHVLRDAGATALDSAAAIGEKGGYGNRTAFPTDYGRGAPKTPTVPARRRRPALPACPCPRLFRVPRRRAARVVRCPLPRGVTDAALSWSPRPAPAAPGGAGRSRRLQGGHHGATATQTPAADPAGAGS